MTELLERLAGFLVAPAAPAARVDVRPVSTAAVAGAERDAPAVGAAVALGLARTACVAIWRHAPPDPPPATTSGGTIATRRLVSRLRAHGFEACGRGRLAWVALPGDPAQAVAAWERLTGRIEAPAVLVLARARAEAFDPALADADRVVLVAPTDADPALVELAAAGLPHVEVAGPLPLVAKWGALAGLGSGRLDASPVTA